MRFRSADSLGPEHIGRRVTVRRRLPEGGLGDVIGVLERLDESIIVIVDRRGMRHHIAVAEVVAARVIGAPNAPA